MKRKPGPGDVLLWRGSNDVIGTNEPVILVEPTIDPLFWVVAELDEQGLPKPYTFAVPLEDLVPVESLVPESSGLGTPRLPGDAARRALLRVGVGVATAASFALGAMSLVGHQPSAPIAEGLRPTPSGEVTTVPALGGSPRELRDQPSGSSQAGSSLVGGAAVRPRVSTGAPASGGVGGASGGGTSRGGTNGGGAGAGSPIGDVSATDTNPGNSGSPPGHTSTPGNSGTAPGHNSSPGHSGSAPGHGGSAHGHNSGHGHSGSPPGHD